MVDHQLTFMVLAGIALFILAIVGLYKIADNFGMDGLTELLFYVVFAALIYIGPPALLMYGIWAFFIEPVAP